MEFQRKLEVPEISSLGYVLSNRAPKMQVLYEDNHLLVVVKPAGLPTMGVAEGEKSLLTVARHYIGEKYHKPGNVYLGIVSRLDTPTTGVVVIARTSKAADRLNQQFRTRSVEKTYLALVDGLVGVPGETGTLTDRMGEDPRHRKMFVTQSASGIPAVLHYTVLRYFENTTLLEIHLETGRKHQIRVQMSHFEHPVTGDYKYRSRAKFPVGIALHAWRLAFEHPTLRTRMVMQAELPPSWEKFLHGPVELPELEGGTVVKAAGWVRVEGSTGTTESSVVTEDGVVTGEPVADSTAPSESAPGEPAPDTLEKGKVGSG